MPNDFEKWNNENSSTSTGGVTPSTGGTDFEKWNTTQQQSSATMVEPAEQTWSERLSGIKNDIINKVHDVLTPKPTPVSMIPSLGEQYSAVGAATSEVPAANPPVKGFVQDTLESAKDFAVGAVQGLQERYREEQGLKSIANVDRYGIATPKEGITQEQVDAQEALVNKAKSNFNNETVVPTLMFTPAAAVILPGMLAKTAVETYQGTEGTPLEKAGNAARSVTYGPIVDWANDPELMDKWQKNPARTLASGAMAAGQAVLPVIGARYGIKKAGEIKNDIVNHVENQINAPLQETATLDRLNAPIQEFKPVNETIKPLESNISAENPLQQPTMAQGEVFPQRPIGSIEAINRVEPALNMNAEKLVTNAEQIKQPTLNIESSRLPHQDLVDAVESRLKANMTGVQEPSTVYKGDNTTNPIQNASLEIGLPVNNKVSIIERQPTGLKAMVEKIISPYNYMKDKAYTDWIDSLAKIKNYDEEVYKQARMTSRKAKGMADSMLNNPNNPMSFDNITKPVQDDLSNLSEYMVAMRAAELHKKGIQTGLTNKQIIDTIENARPTIKTVQEKLVKYSDNLLNVLIDSQVISKEHAQNMRNKYGDYAPMMKAFEGEQIYELDQPGVLGAPIRNIAGSTAKVVDPLESLLKNTYTFHMLAETNELRTQIAGLSEKSPNEIKILKTGETKEHGTGVMEYFVDGKKTEMQLSPDLYDALKSMDSTESGIVLKVLSTPAQILRFGATASPEFFVKNLVRDTIGATILGKGFIPGLDTLKGLKSAYSKDSAYWAYKEAGGELGSMSGLGKEQMQEMLDNYRTKSKIQKVASTAFSPKKWGEVVSKIQEVGENANRIGYFKRRVSKGDLETEAAFESADLLDFGRHGTKGQEVNKIVAFFNATLQGGDKFLRVMKERPLATSAKIISCIVLPSIATWYLGKDDTRIQELPQYQKDLFWIIPTKNALIRIPKPFEVGVLFGSGTERSLAAMYNNQRHPFKDFSKSAWDAVMPSIMPSAMIPIGEWWAGKSSFTGQDIVPQREQGLPAQYQYGVNTSNIAKTTGHLAGKTPLGELSPRKIDQAIKGLTGGGGTMITDIVDWATGGNGTIRPTRTLSDMPVLKAFLADPRKGQQATQDFYDELKTYSEKHQAATMGKEKMSNTDNANYILLSGTNAGLSALHKQQRTIMDSTTMSPQDKREKLDKLIDSQSKLTQMALNNLR